MDEFLAGGLPSEWHPLIKRSPSTDDDVVSIENFSEDTNSSQALDDLPREFAKADASEVQQYVESVWQSEDRKKELTDFKNSLLKDMNNPHGDTPLKATDWLETVDLISAIPSASSSPHFAGQHKSINGMKVSFITGGYAEQLRNAQDNLLRNELEPTGDALNFRVDLVLWCYSLLVTQCVLLNKEGEEDSYCLVFFHCKSELTIMEGSFVTVYPPFHLDYLGSNDKGSSFICPVYMAKQYEIDNHKATTLSMSSDYDISPLTNTCHSNLLKSRALLRHLFHESKLHLKQLLDMAPDELHLHVHQESSSFISYNQTATSLLEALEIYCLDKISFTATVKSSVFKNNEHQITKRGIGCHEEGRWALLLEDKDGTLSKLMIENKHFIKWKELVERGEGLQCLFYNVSVLRKEGSNRDWPTKNCNSKEMFAIATICYVLQTKFDSYWEKK